MKKFLKIFLSFLLVSVASFTLVGCGGDNTPKPSNTKKTYTITIETNNEEYGSVMGAGIYTEGEHMTMVAVPKEGYTFVCWNDQQNTENPRTIKVRSDYTYVATFKKETGIFNLDNVGIYVNEPINENLATIKLDRLKICVDYKKGGPNKEPLDNCLIGGFNTKPTSYYAGCGYNLYSHANSSKNYTYKNPSIIYASKNALNIFEENVSKHIYIEMNLHITLTNGDSFSKFACGEFDIKPTLEGSSRNLTTVIINSNVSFDINLETNFVKK